MRRSSVAGGRDPRRLELATTPWWSGSSRPCRADRPAALRPDARPRRIRLPRRGCRRARVCRRPRRDPVARTGRLPRDRRLRRGDRARQMAGWPLLPSLVARSRLRLRRRPLDRASQPDGCAAAFVAVSTWILSWIVVLALTSFPGISGGAQGLVLPEAEVLRPHSDSDCPLRDRAHAPRPHRPSRSRFSRGERRASRSRPRASAQSPPLALGVPVARLRLGAFAASAVIAGLAGALGVELARSPIASAYGPALSFKLFVAVIIGGARTPLGPVRRPCSYRAFSNAAEQIGGAPGPPAGTARGDAHRLRHAARPRARWRGLLPSAAASAAGSAEPRPAEASSANAIPSARGASGRGARAVRPAGLRRATAASSPSTTSISSSPPARARADRTERRRARRPRSGPRRRASTRLRLDRARERGSRTRCLSARVLAGSRRHAADDRDLPRLTVLENALVGAGLRPRRRAPSEPSFGRRRREPTKAQAEQTALGALELVGLLEDPEPARRRADRPTSSACSCWPRPSRPSRASCCSTSRPQAASAAELDRLVGAASRTAAQAASRCS